MNKDELINTLEIAKAEVEWNYPLDYATAIDQAVKYATAIDQAVKYAEIPEKLIKAIEKMQTYKMFCGDKTMYIEKELVIELIKELVKEAENG